MKILLTLDYEMFLGKNPGTIQNNLILPIGKILKEASKYNIKLTIFVDAAYLFILNKFSSRNEELLDDYNQIVQNLLEINEQGHDIELHVHPQWFYSDYENSKWHLDHKHYKIADLKLEDAKILFKEAIKVLEAIVLKKIIAFRAGGFSAQPTELLTYLMKENELYTDSSVFSKSSYNSDFQKYNYRHIPSKGVYRFSKDLCVEDISGEFVEIPVSSVKLFPWFYWTFVFNRYVNKKYHSNFGDGYSIKTTKKDILKRLLLPTYGLATIDGYKISYLENIIKKNRRSDLVTILGHPKLTTPYSIDRFSIFLQRNSKKYEFTTISDLIANYNQ
jgi:peptidoglycan/xylan/chitin deacetylase (PgdA/CDA1 family)